MEPNNVFKKKTVSTAGYTIWDRTLIGTVSEKAIW